MLRKEDERSKSNARVVKEMNRRAIRTQLHQQPRLSRAEIAKQTGLSRPCVSSLVDEMIEEGLIYEIGVGKSSGGRRPILLEMNYQAFAVAGAVIRGDSLLVGIADLKGDLLATCRRSLTRLYSAAHVAQALREAVDKLIDECQLRRSQLLGIGVGLPGITQQTSGTVSYAPSTGWMGLPLKREIEEWLGLEVVIDNDVNFMALGEYSRRGGNTVQNLVYAYMGTGIGAGIIINGQIYRGSKEAAGEIGYMMIGPENPGGPEEFGTFERNYSLVGLFERVKALDPTLQGETGIIKRLLELVESGQPGASELYDEALRFWSYGLVNIISTLDPELLILSGEWAALQADQFGRLKSLLQRWAPVVPQIEAATLDDQAGLIGAAYSALQTFVNFTGVN